MVLAREEELMKAQAEAWSKTHYRTDWLLSRTLGYAILSSTLAIYVFWAEAGHTQTAEVQLGLSGSWMVLQSLAMLWYDFSTRVSYENWPEVRRRLLRHIWVSILSFVVALGFAFGIHGLATLIDNVTPDPNAIAASQPKIHDPNAPVVVRPLHPNGKRTISSSQGYEKRMALAALAAKNAKKPAADKTAAPKPNGGKPATTKPAVKTPAKTAAKPVAKKAAPVKKAVAPVKKKKKVEAWHPPIKLHHKKKHHRA